MGKKHKKHHKEERDDNDGLDHVSTTTTTPPVLADPFPDKPAGLKLVLKVGSQSISADSASVDSQSEVGDSDTASSEKRLKLRKRHHDVTESGDKRRRHDDDDDELSKDELEDNEGDKELNHTASEEPDATVEDEGRTRHLRDKRALDDDKPALYACLDYLQKVLQRKDTNGFFAFPVTDSIAPDYSKVISDPIDFSTMRAKIDNWEYRTVAEYRADYQRMMENCITYNHPDTVYYREAKRLLSVGLKHMSREQLLHMKRNLPSMAGLTVEDIGMDDDTADSALGGNADLKSRSTKEKTPQRKPGMSRFEAIPDKLSPEEILQQAQKAARIAADRLSLRAPNSKIAFLRRRDDGSTTLNILNPDNSGIVSETERVVTLGEMIGKVSAGSGTLIGLKDDKRNKVNPINYLSYGAFSSYGPVYDSSLANLSKEDSDLLLSTYGDEAGLQYARSLQQFVTDAGPYCVKMVDNLLDILTSGEHSKTSAVILEHERERQQQEQEEIRKRNEVESANKSSENNQPAESEGPESACQKQLDNISQLLAELYRMQNARLGQQPPDHLADVSKISDQETQLGRKVSAELASLLKQVMPSTVVSTSMVRNALGLSGEAAADAAQSASAADAAPQTIVQDSGPRHQADDKDMDVAAADSQQTVAAETNVVL